MSPLKRQHVASDDGGADRKILMAVDFGTTFSGLAWSQTRKVGTRIFLLSMELISIRSRRSRRLSYAGPMPFLGAWRASAATKCQRKLRTFLVPYAEDPY